MDEVLSTRFLQERLFFPFYGKGILFDFSILGGVEVLFFFPPGLSFFFFFSIPLASRFSNMGWNMEFVGVDFFFIYADRVWMLLLCVVVVYSPEFELR